MAHKRWGPVEKNFIKANAAKMTDQQLAAALSRLTKRPFTLSAVRTARLLMGIKKASGRGYCKVVKRPTQQGGAPLTMTGE